MESFNLLDETYYYGVDTSSFEMGETTSDYYDNYFPFPLNSNAYGGSEPFQVGGKFGINFVSHSNSRVKLCDYKFTLDDDSTTLWIELVSTNTNIDGLTIPYNDLSCAGINQTIWNYLYKNKAGKDIATTNALFNSITHILWEEWNIYGTLDIYYKNSDEKILSTDIEYNGYVGDICKVFTVYLNAYEASLGLSTKSFTFNFSNGNLLGDYLLIPKLNKIKWLLDDIDPKVQPIFGPNSIDAILNRLTEKNTILIKGQDITGNTLTKTLLTFTDPYDETIGIDYKVVPYGPNYTNSYGTVDSSYDLAFKQSAITSYYLNYSVTNNVINTSSTGITLYNTAIKQPTNVTAGQQNVYVYLFDEDESRTYTDLTEFNNSTKLLTKTNFIPCYPTTLLHTSGTTLSDISSGLLESISYGFRNNSVTYSKTANFAQGSLTPTGMLSVTYTGTTNFSLSPKKQNTWPVTLDNMKHNLNFGNSAITTTDGTTININGRSGNTTATVYFYTTNNTLIESGSTTGKFSITGNIGYCSSYNSLSFSKLSGNTTYTIVTKVSLSFVPVISKTVSSNVRVSCTGSFDAKYTKPGLYFNFNVGSSAYSPVYYSGTTYYYPALCNASFKTGSKAISNGAITKEGFSFTSKKFLMVDGVPRACNSSYFLSGNVILLPDYKKGYGNYCLYIGARKITQRILDRSYGIHVGELTFTTDYVCSKSFKTSAWSSYTQPNISYNEIYPSSSVDETSYYCYPSMPGRNLLRNTASWTWGPGASQYYFSAITPTIGFKPSTIYTFSAKRIHLSSGDTVRFAIYDSSITTYRLLKDFVIKRTGDSNKYCFTFRTGSDVVSTDKFLIYSGKAGGCSGVTLTMSRFKLEEGSCATDWSPAPEDSGAFLNMPFKCSDALATANDITEKVCCLFAPSYRYKTGSSGRLSNIYNYLLTETESTIYDNIGASGGVGYIDKLGFEGSAGIGACFTTKYVDVYTVSNSSNSSIGKAILGYYASNEYNIRQMTYPTFKSPTATTITYVNGLCIPFAADRLVIVNLGNNYAMGTCNFQGTYSLYYHDGCVSDDYSASGFVVSGYIGYASGYLGVDDIILPNEANGSYIKDMYLGLIDESLNSQTTNPLVSATIGSLGLVMCDESEKIPTVERVFRKNTTEDIVSYQCYGIMKFDFDKMLYYMDTSVYIKIIDNNYSFNYSFNTVALSEDFCYQIYFCNEQISSEIIYPLSYDTILETTHIKPTLYVTEDMAELNFRIYETNKIPFNATGVFLKIGFSFPLKRVRSTTLSYFETDIMNVSDILLQQGYTQQDDVFMYIPSLGSSEFANNLSPSLQYATRAGGGYSGNQTGLKLTCTTVSATSVNYGARWTASSLTKLKNLTGTSQSTCVKSGTSIITTAIIMGTVKTTTAISANPLNYNSGNSPLAGTLNMQNKAIEVWYLMHAAVSNAPSGSNSYTSNYNGTTNSKSRMSSNIYTRYLDTLPSYIYGGFRPANNTTYLLNNHLIKYLGISYLNDAGYNNLFQ